MTPEENRRELERWRGFFKEHIHQWVQEEPLIEPSHGAVSIASHAAWRPINNPDLPAEELPSGWSSLGHDPDSIPEHLQSQSDLYSDALDKAIVEWSSTWIRPRLPGDLGFNFSLRLQFGRDVIDGIATGQPLPEHLDGNMPELNNYPEYLKWLLISAWDELGNSYLQFWAQRQRSPMRFKIEGHPPE